VEDLILARFYVVVLKELRGALLLESRCWRVSEGVFEEIERYGV
jgi:hypothetical protein